MLIFSDTKTTRWGWFIYRRFYHHNNRKWNNYNRYHNHWNNYNRNHNHWNSRRRGRLGTHHWLVRYCFNYIYHCVGSFSSVLIYPLQKAKNPRLLPTCWLRNHSSSKFKSYGTLYSALASTWKTHLNVIIISTSSLLSIFDFKGFKEKWTPTYRKWKKAFYVSNRDACIV